MMRRKMGSLRAEYSRMHRADVNFIQWACLSRLRGPKLNRPFTCRTPAMSPRQPDNRPAVLADVGGTNARFALFADGAIVDSQVFTCADFPSLEAVAAAYLAVLPQSARPRRGAFAIAGPVAGDEIHMVNRGWTFSADGVRRGLNLDRLAVINDFTAVALSVPRLGDQDSRGIGGGTTVEGRPVAVLGPGSGLGVSGLLPRADGGWVALSGEGGHATMAACDDREAAVLSVLRQEMGHVSSERVLSGPGLEALYRGLCRVDGVTAGIQANHLIMAAALAPPSSPDHDHHALEAMTMFCALLGTVAGNLALTLGAFGGVYIGGGIVPRLGSWFDSSPFRARFEAKGRLTAYLKDIPTRLITHPLPAFLGLLEALDN